jgi:hypothetical protein
MNANADTISTILDGARIAGRQAAGNGWSNADTAVAYWLRGGSTNADQAAEIGIAGRAESAFVRGFMDARTGRA